MRVTDRRLPVAAAAEVVFVEQIRGVHRRVVIELVEQQDVGSHPLQDFSEPDEPRVLVVHERGRQLAGPFQPHGDVERGDAQPAPGGLSARLAGSQAAEGGQEEDSESHRGIIRAARQRM
jgi:hypothetical protein